MKSFPRSRKRRFDPAALVLGSGAGLGAYGRRGMAGLSPLGSAIAGAEGFGPAGNIPTLTNNPGDLELGDIGYGTTTAAGGQQITNFPSLSAGQAALENQINLIASGQSTAGYTPSMSIAQVGQLYSGGSSNWAANVAAALGVTPDTNFASLAGSTPSADASASASVATDATGDGSIDLSSLFGDSSTSWLTGGVAALLAVALAAWAVAD